MASGMGSKLRQGWSKSLPVQWLIVCGHSEITSFRAAAMETSTEGRLEMHRKSFHIHRGNPGSESLDRRLNDEEAQNLIFPRGQNKRWFIKLSLLGGLLE